MSKVNYDAVLRTIHKMNLECTPTERIHWNRLKYDLFDVCDKIRDLAHASNSRLLGNGSLPELAERLYNIISKIPMLEK